MKLVALLALLICSAGTCRAAGASELAIVFVTEDAGGVHSVLIKNGAARVRTQAKGQALADQSYDYDPARAQRLWKEIEQLAKDGLAGETPSGDANAHAERNYLIVLKAEDGAKQSLSFPKCARNARVDDTMQRLTSGLLPAGSPGIRPGACEAPKRAAAIEALAEKLPELCGRLQKKGWLLPQSPLHPGKRESMEAYGIGQLYMCMLERDVPGRGPGHKPQLQVLMSDLPEKNDPPSITFSLSVWCDADRAAALGALADAVDSGLGAIELKAPAPLLDAARNGRAGSGRGADFGFKTELSAVDPHACSTVRDGQLGAMLFGYSATIDLTGPKP